MGEAVDAVGWEEKNLSANLK